MTKAVKTTVKNREINILQHTSSKKVTVCIKPNMRQHSMSIKLTKDRLYQRQLTFNGLLVARLAIAY